ncbi:hypothetical protein EDB19DRAFT_1910603 [Suillus lakei]|nr:hypothetical protein EDB19DRAFT_1910603 [Suillus lakei]
MSLCALFIIFRNITESGWIKNPEDVRGMLAELKWPFHTSAFREITIQLMALGDSDINELIEDSIIMVVESVQQYLKENGFTLFSYILELWLPSGS